jgi:hypothetical protein
MLAMSASTAVAWCLLVILPIVCALLLRWVRCPGWAVVGGAVAGILLGPSILGRIAPEVFEEAVVGGFEQRQALESLRRRQGADVLAARTAGLDEEAMIELDVRHRAEREPLEEKLREARWEFQQPMRIAVSVVIVLTLLGGGWRGVREGDRRQGLIAPLSIGAWSSLLPGALAYFGMTWLWRHPPAPSLLAAAAVAIGPWVLTTADRESADEAEFGGARMIQTAGRIASVIAIGAAFVALAMTRGAAGVLWCLPLLALPLGWLAPGKRGRPRRWGRESFSQEKGSGVVFRAEAEETAQSGALRGSGSFPGAVLEIILVPLLAACVGMKIDIYAHFAFWPIVVFILLSGDGRWLGALMGALLPGGRRGMRTMRLVMGSMACGPTQLAAAAVAAHTWAMPESIAYALLLGAVYIEMSTPLRRIMARRLEQTEEEIEE